MGLADLFRKKTTKEKIAAKKTNYAGERLDRLDKDGNLPWGWLYANKDFCKQIQGEYGYFLLDWGESRKQSPKRQYEALKSLVLWLNDAKKLCFSKGECFAKWFTNIIADDEFISKRQAELDEITKNFDSLDKAWKEKQIKQSMLPKLECEVKEALLQYDGIYQPDFVKMFDEAIQQDVKDILYRLDKEGVLQRTKQGRSYVLHIKK